MHRAFRQALEDAEGRSQFIFVVFADIRGFSAFSQRHESPDVAMYIKRVYAKLIDDYFSFASFYKPTGDGLLMTVAFNERDLEEKARATVSACLRCLDEFATICAGDAMINFEPPGQIGFGVTRGTACCLMSGDSVLDYSGHILNVASRLKDLAHPSGIILDGGFGIELLSEEQQSLFEAADVYIRSVAEDEPRKVYFLKGSVEIPEHAKRPLRFEEWQTIQDVKTLAAWKAVEPPRWIVELPKRLRRPDGLHVVVEYPILKRGERTGHAFKGEFVGVEYAVRAGTPEVYIATDRLCELLRRGRVSLKTPVKVTIAYVPE